MSRVKGREKPLTFAGDRALVGGLGPVPEPSRLPPAHNCMKRSTDDVQHHLRHQTSPVPERATLDLGALAAMGVELVGFRPDYRWLDVPVLDAKGQLRHDGGVVIDSRPIRPGPARAAQAQVHVHPRHRGRRARGDRRSRSLSGRTVVLAQSSQLNLRLRRNARASRSLTPAGRSSAWLNAAAACGERRMPDRSARTSSALDAAAWTTNAETFRCAAAAALADNCR